jgi:hypothetical protein
MYRNRNNANLMEELEGRQMAVATMNMPSTYKNFYKAQIAALEKELNRRRRTRAANVIKKKFKNIYYEPNNTGTGLRGRGYRMAMARMRGNNSSQVSSREHVMRVLKTKLNNLRRQTNRGAMVNIYNSMGRNWAKAGGIVGANVMNNAQKIMFRAGLI